MNPMHPASNPGTQSLPHLTVFGASRGVGRLVVEQALAEGHHVTAVSRDVSQLHSELSHPRLHLVAGDAMNSAIVKKALEKADAVACTLGAPALSSSKIRSEGIKVIIAEMKKRGLKRIVALSLLGAHETRGQLPFFVRYFVFPFYLRKPVLEHELQESLLASSELDWTVLRPPFLVDGPRTGNYELDLGEDWSHLRLEISRADAADFFVRHLPTSERTQQKVGISYVRSPS